MKKQTILVTVAMSLAMASTAWAGQGNAEAGKEKATTVCAACHGADGNSPAPNFPKLAGQNADFLQYTLKQYRNKKRSNAIMNGQAESLTDKEIADLSAYYAQQKGLVVKR